VTDAPPSAVPADDLDYYGSCLIMAKRIGLDDADLIAAMATQVHEALVDVWPAAPKWAAPD
jgi:hypothetical protein